MINSPINIGYESAKVTVECNTSNGLPSLIIVGLANKAVDEAKERLRSAITKSGYQFPKKKIIINLAPADLPKNSSTLDLAMAISVLVADKQIKLESNKSYSFIGELGLNGDIKPARGVIGLLRSLKNMPDSIAYVPAENSNQISHIANSNILFALTLRDVVEHLNGNVASLPKKASHKSTSSLTDKECLDLAEIKGQDNAKRALTIAAAGGHNILLSGPPGTGKSMLAKAFVGILPDLTAEQALVTTHIHSLAGLSTDDLLWRPPLRAPHHTSSNVAIIGGGHTLKPGEISLSHNGVLFLDEIPEFQKQALEGLRQPLEDGLVSISRAQSSTTYPANFIMIATSNPCPCGYYNTSKSCHCSAQEIARYQKKLSGPILDRIDIHISVNDVDHKSLLKDNPTKESDISRKTVSDARQHQIKRSKTINANLSNKQLKEAMQLSPEAKDFLNSAAEKLNISARAYMKTVKVARTIADLDNSSEINTAHIAESLQYRSKYALL